MVRNVRGSIVRPTVRLATDDGSLEFTRTAAGLFYLRAWNVRLMRSFRHEAEKAGILVTEVPGDDADVFQCSTGPMNAAALDRLTEHPAVDRAELIVSARIGQTAGGSGTLSPKGDKELRVHPLHGPRRGRRANEEAAALAPVAKVLEPRLNAEGKYETPLAGRKLIHRENAERATCGIVRSLTVVELLAEFGR